MTALAGDLPPALLAGHFADPAILAKALLAALRDGDVVMIKASNGARFSVIVQTLLGTKTAAPAGAR